jgi:UDP-N-acetylmuramoyl-tripeptide--D-alanyl-D-alanine ligase
VLSEKYSVLYTQGNFNNDIGVPKTLLRLNKDHEIAIIEMGASHPGDIKTLAETAEPDYGIITNVGRAHLQGFGSFEGVVQTKGELYDYLRTKPDSLIFLHNENEHLAAIAKGLNIIRYGTDEAAALSVSGKVVACNPKLEIALKMAESQDIYSVKTNIVGTYNLMNMLAAAAIGKHFGVDNEQICHALSNYVPSNNRSQLTVTESNSLVVDAYNANPTSMMAALRNFREMQVERKMVILGDMKELGEVSAEEHQRCADYLKDCSFDTVWLVGEEFGKTDCDFRKFNSADEVKTAINEDKPKGYYILIKGSNSIKLYLLPEYL